MSDEIDAQQARDELYAPYLLEASKRPVGPVANGICHWCDEHLEVTIAKRFCNAECRDQYDSHAARCKVLGKRP